MTLLRAVMLVAALAVMLPLSATPAPAQAADCEFVLGFKAIHDLIPDKVGDCQNMEYHGSNGDGLQNTTAWHGKGGLLAWRKADNWTAFTDGADSWVNGPYGLQKRQNGYRFPWEANPESLPIVGGTSPTVQPPISQTPVPPTATPPTPPTATPASPCPPATVPMAQHEDAQKKFQYPKGWVPVRGCGGRCYGYIEPNGRALILYYAPFNMPGQRLDELAYAWVHDVQGEKSISIGALEQMTVNGFPATIMNYEATASGGVKMRGMFFVIKNGNLVYEVDYYADSSRWAEYEPNFRKSVCSFVPKAAN